MRGCTPDKVCKAVCKVSCSLKQRVRSWLGPIPVQIGNPPQPNAWALTLLSRAETRVSAGLFGWFEKILQTDLCWAIEQKPSKKKLHRIKDLSPPETTKARSSGVQSVPELGAGTPGGGALPANARAVSSRSQGE